MCAVFIIHGYMQQAIQLLYQLVATLVLQRLKETTSEAAKLHVDVWFNYNYRLRYKGSCLLMCIIG